MAVSLQRLVSLDSFGILQEKLEKWNQDYHYNSCDENVARGCEIIELNARIQSQLFKLLSICAAEGGIFGGASVIKSRLLPLLGAGFFSGGLSSDTSLALLADIGSNRRDIEDIKRVYENSLQDLEADLNDVKDENRQLKEELEETRVELDRQSRTSASEKMFTETEMRDLRNRLSDLEFENTRLRARQGLPLEPIRPASRPLSRSASPGPPVPPLEQVAPSARPSSRGLSPLSYESQQLTQQLLISRFNELFSIARLDAMTILRRYCDDHENNQRVIHATLQESFSAARHSFHSYKSSLRSRLAITHTGPETLEEAVQLYLNRHPEPVDVSRMINETIRALSRYSRFHVSAPTGYDVITSFIRESCILAWQMYALPHALDLAPSCDGEILDEGKYRRSYDSEFGAVLVNHFIWPCLMQGARVVVKGEACTRRSGSMSPRRTYSPTRSLSRSASPVRNGNAKLSSRSRGRSPEPFSTARTNSTSLSHYIK